MRSSIIPQLGRLAAKHEKGQRAVAQDHRQDEKRSDQYDEQTFRRARGLVNRKLLRHDIGVEGISHSEKTQCKERNCRDEGYPGKTVIRPRQVAQKDPKKRDQPKRHRRERKKQEAIERSKARQANKDYFQSKKEASEKGEQLLKKAKEDPSIEVVQVGEEDDDEDDDDDDDPFRSYKPKKKGLGPKIFVK